MGAYYQDDSGQEHPIIMGCYGMGVVRLLACVVEANHDERGIIWPMTVAPYHVHIVALGTSPEVREAADGLYEALLKQGTEVLYDDRDESAGVKFNDADLMVSYSHHSLREEPRREGGAEAPQGASGSRPLLRRPPWWRQLWQARSRDCRKEE